MGAGVGGGRAGRFDGAVSRRRALRHLGVGTALVGAAACTGAPLPAEQEALCAESEWDFSDLRALYLNCTLKPTPQRSNTQGLADLSIAIMERNGVAVDVVRAVDHEIAPGTAHDMTLFGAARDDWPELAQLVAAADIVVLMTPIWLGDTSSVCGRVVERLFASSFSLNDAGQLAFYGKVGGSIVTGNEDGAKHCAMKLLFSLQSLGFLVPPQVDAAWVGEAGPGPSYLDEGSGGPENDFTNRQVTFMTWNLLHAARMLVDAGGFPAHGNQVRAWQDGCRFDLPDA